MSSFYIKAINDGDRAWIVSFLAARWGSAQIVTRGQLRYPNRLPGFIARQDDARIGLLTYRIDGDECEIITLDSAVEGLGVGTALIEAAKIAATEAGCRRLWLITTNDNLPALRFYQKRGFRLAALRVNALKESRKLKPEIPLVGLDGIPLRDEIELEMWLA